MSSPALSVRPDPQLDSGPQSPLGRGAERGTGEALCALTCHSWAQEARSGLEMLTGGFLGPALRMANPWAEETLGGPAVTAKASASHGARGSQDALQNVLIWSRGAGHLSEP